MGAAPVALMACMLVCLAGEEVLVVTHRSLLAVDTTPLANSSDASNSTSFFGRQLFDEGGRSIAIYSAAAAAVPTMPGQPRVVYGSGVKVTNNRENDLHGILKFQEQNDGSFSLVGDGPFVSEFDGPTLTDASYYHIALDHVSNLLYALDKSNYLIYVIDVAQDQPRAHIFMKAPRNVEYFALAVDSTHRLLYYVELHKHPDMYVSHSVLKRRHLLKKFRGCDFDSEEAVKESEGLMMALSLFEDWVYILMRKRPERFVIRVHRQTMTEETVVALPESDMVPFSLLVLSESELLVVNHWVRIHKNEKKRDTPGVHLCSVEEGSCIRMNITMGGDRADLVTFDNSNVLYGVARLTVAPTDRPIPQMDFADEVPKHLLIPQAVTLSGRNITWSDQDKMENMQWSVSAVGGSVVEVRHPYITWNETECGCSEVEVRSHVQCGAEQLTSREAALARVCLLAEDTDCVPPPTTPTPPSSSPPSTPGASTVATSPGASTPPLAPRVVTVVKTRTHPASLPVAGVSLCFLLAFIVYAVLIVVKMRRRRASKRYNVTYAGGGHSGTTSSRRPLASDFNTTPTVRAAGNVNFLAYDDMDVKFGSTIRYENLQDSAAKSGFSSSLIKLDDDIGVGAGGKRESAWKYPFVDAGGDQRTAGQLDEREAARMLEGANQGSMSSIGTEVNVAIAYSETGLRLARSSRTEDFRASQS